MKAQINDQTAKALNLDDVYSLIAPYIVQLESQYIALAQAHDRVCANAVDSACNVPTYAVSAMDGYAIATEFEDLNLPLEIKGESLAGHPYPKPLEPGQAIYITTGAQVPKGCSRVLIKEICERSGSSITHIDTPGTERFIRKAGSDIVKNRRLVEAGKTLNARDIAVLAAAGFERIAVKRRPIVGIMSTGDEIAQSADTKDSNRPMLAALFSSLGCELQDYGCISDDPISIRHAITKAAKACDLIISSGGVSVGRKDFVRPELAAQGQILSQKMRLKPGKPMTIAVIDNSLFFALPGNPVSAFVMSLLLVIPTLRAMLGRKLQLPQAELKPLSGELSHSPGRAEFQRVIRDCASIKPAGEQDSHLLSVLQVADGLAFVEADSTGHAAGDILPYYDFNRLISLNE